jgi:2-phospho-L-lactate guanylyltransferase
MQATVAAFDEDRHHGSLLLDDGTPLDFPAEAFEVSGLRLLRPGQRVRIERDATGAVVAVTLATFT